MYCALIAFAQNAALELSKGFQPRESASTMNPIGHPAAYALERHASIWSLVSARVLMNPLH